MKTKGILSFVLFCLAMTASAQVQLLFFDGGRHVIDRNKKLYWMDAGDEDPCFDIINYKKTGNKETFTLKCKEKERYGQPSTYSATLTMDGDKTVELLVTGKGADGIEKFAGKVKNTSGSAYEDQRLKDYFNGGGEHSCHSSSADECGRSTRRRRERHCRESEGCGQGRTRKNEGGL